MTEASPVSGAGLTTPEPQGSVRGGPHPPHEVSGPGRSHRVVRVPLERLPDEDWVALRRLAYRCAQYANHLLSESYVTAKGGPKLPTYTDAKGDLSAAIRDAVGREVVGIWRRLGRMILRGEQTLARFSANRALVVRDRGVRLARHADAYTIVLRLHPGATEETRTELKVWMPALRRDPWLADRLARLAAGTDPITKATVVFERPGRAVFVLLSYARDDSHISSGGDHATLGPLTDDGQLWVRSAAGRARSFTDQVYRLRAMKTHYAGVHDRLRMSLGKTRRYHDLRRSLRRAGSYETWAQGPLHELSHHVVAWCQREGVGSLEWGVAEDGSLPWDRLAGMLKYKCVDAGIAFSQLAPPPPQNATLRNDDAVDAPEVSGKPRRRKRFQATDRRGVE